MKIICWNVNGFRAVLKKGFVDFLNLEKPDIIGIQEIKMGQEAIEKEALSFDGYEILWNPAERPGYSGTLILLKESLSPIKKTLGLGIKKFDNEGRLQTVEFKDFYFLNIYFPNANHKLSRLGYKQEFNKEFIRYVKKLQNKKPVIACGDYNVAHEEIDLARPKENMGSPGFTTEERFWMDKFLQNGLVDIYRKSNKNKVKYTWWSYRAGARARNVGWRIDYFLVSKKIEKKVKNSFIQDKIIGSDHCPLGIIL